MTCTLSINKTMHKIPDGSAQKRPQLVFLECGIWSDLKFPPSYLFFIFQMCYTKYFVMGNIIST